MRIVNFPEKIKYYKSLKLDLDDEKIGTLLSIDTLYSQIPNNLDIFKDLYPYFDPKIINNPIEGITFLKLINSYDTSLSIKKKINDYINIKFNYLGNSKEYDLNMEKFREYSKIISNFYDDILNISDLPQGIVDILKEKEIIKNSHDAYDLFKTYRSTTNRRIKFEILRKFGFIILLSLITRSFIIDELDFALSQVKKIFIEGLGLVKKQKNAYYLWLNKNNKPSIHYDVNKAILLHKNTINERKKLCLDNHPMQKIYLNSFGSKFTLDLLHIETRNKLRRNGNIYYSSILEKIIRKNLEFPREVHDVIGIKIVIEDEKQIPDLVVYLESFLGGTTTRKQEKNSLHKFGRRKLSRYSSDEYSVWKAVYNIALPHPSIQQVEYMLNLTKDNPRAQSELLKRPEYFKNRPRDYVVEVQLQDINSYLLGITLGSTAFHDNLKMIQVRTNSFYKIFPPEIYEKEMDELKVNIINSK